MGRGGRPGGDILTIGTVAGASTKKYPLAPVAQNISYETESDQPEARPNQPLAVPLSFHGGTSYSRYDPQQAGALLGDGVICNEPNVLYAAPATSTTTLTGAANPPMYFFEADVNDSGADDTRPRLYVIACEAAEINVYKLSLAYGYTATGTGVTTATAATLEDDRATWTVDEWIGEIVTCNSQTLTVTGNTATVLTGSGNWSSDPGDAAAYKIGVGDFGTLLNTKTFAVTPTQPMGRPALWKDASNAEWRLGTGDTTNDIQSLSSIASGAAADTWGKDDADARHLFVVGEQLYRTTGANEVSVLEKATDPEDEGVWGDEFPVGSAATKITDIAEVGGVAYLCKEDGFFEWDGVAKARNILPEIGKDVRNGQGVIYWHGGFMIPASALWWTRTGKPVGPDSSPYNRGSDPSFIASVALLKGGKWAGLAGLGEYIFGLYIVNATAAVMWGRERDSSDPPGWGPIIWHCLDRPTADLDDFHGIFVAETAELTLSKTRPCLFYPHGNDLRHIFLDKDGSPQGGREETSVRSGNSFALSGRIDFGMPRVLKQLRVIDGWAADLADAGHAFVLTVFRDEAVAASVESVGATITSNGYFERFWTQDTGDTTRALKVYVRWTGTSGLTGTNAPHLRDLTVRAVALPDTTNTWTFLVAAEDESSRTAKAIRTEMEAYKKDLKKYELPDGDSFNGVLTGIRMLRANEVRDLAVDEDNKGKKLPLPRYIMAATVREMVSS